MPADIEVTHAGTAWGEASSGDRPESATTDPASSHGHDSSAADRKAIVTSGGRVLNVTALGPTAESARTAAYAAAQKISFEGMQLRRDIAANAEREATTTT